MSCLHPAEPSSWHIKGLASDFIFGCEVVKVCSILPDGRFFDRTGGDVMPSILNLVSTQLQVESTGIKDSS